MPRRTWNEATIEAELAPVVAKLGRFPKRAELAAVGLGGLWTAMQRHAGLAAWRERISAPPATPTANLIRHADTAKPVGRDDTKPVHHDDIARRAYFLAQERGGDPIENWLSAERELRAA
jgi:hypothetical protein